MCRSVSAVLQEVRHVTLDKHNHLHTSDPEKQIIVEGGWRNKMARPVMEALGIPVLATWNESLPLWDYHHNYQSKLDCTHMCHPSAYQVWCSSSWSARLPEVQLLWDEDI